MMGNLRAKRLSPGFPSKSQGQIVDKKGRGARVIKCYLCVSICFKIKTAHLKLVSNFQLRLLF